METWRHRRQASVLLDSLTWAWRERQDFFAAANMFVYFSETQARQNDFRGPDFFVVIHTDRHERKSWVAWEEGGRLPDVVVELVSPSTEAVDRGEKMRIYERVWHVATYVIYDPWSGQLDVYRLDASRRYVHLDPDERGDVPCEALGMSLRVVTSVLDRAEAPWLRFVDAQGNVVPEPMESAERHHARAEAESARAEAESARAEAESARAEAESARADVERSRANAAEEKIARLEQELRRKR